MGTGFFSYAHEDDVNSGLTLTWMHERLEQLVRLYGRRDFTLFWDARIHTGEEWRRRLLAELAHTDVFVALLTPGYFASEWCRKEAELALGRLDAGERVAIVPLYLVLDPEYERGEAGSDDLRRRLHALQHHDLRRHAVVHLRGNEGDLARIAQHISSLEPVPAAPYRLSSRVEQRLPLVAPAMDPIDAVPIEDLRKFPNVELARSGHYVARAQESEVLAAAEPRDRGARIVLLSGDGGVGKTALMLRAGVGLARHHEVRRLTAATEVADLAELLDRPLRPVVLLLDEVANHPDLWRYLLHDANTSSTSVIGTVQPQQVVERRVRIGTHWTEVILRPPARAEILALAERVRAVPPGDEPATMLHLIYALGGTGFDEQVGQWWNEASAGLQTLVWLAAWAAARGALAPFDALAEAVRQRVHLDLLVSEERFAGHDASVAGRLLRVVPVQGDIPGVTVALDRMGPLILERRLAPRPDPLVLLGRLQPDRPVHRAFALAIATGSTVPAEVAAAEALLCRAPPLEVLHLWGGSGAAARPLAWVTDLLATGGDDPLRNAVIAWTRAARDDLAAVPEHLRSVLVSIAADPEFLGKLVAVVIAHPELRGGREGTTVIARALAPLVLAGRASRAMVSFVTYYVSPGRDLDRQLAGDLARYCLLDPGRSQDRNAYVLALRILAEDLVALTEDVVDGLARAFGRDDATETMVWQEAKILQRLAAGETQAALVRKWQDVGPDAVVPRQARLDRITRGSHARPGYRVPLLAAADGLAGARDAFERALQAVHEEPGGVASALRALTQPRSVPLMRWAGRQIADRLGGLHTQAQLLRRPITHLLFHWWRSERFFRTDQREVGGAADAVYRWIGPPHAWGPSMMPGDRAFWCEVLRRMGREPESTTLAWAQWDFLNGRNKADDAPERRQLLYQLGNNALQRGEIETAREYAIQLVRGWGQGPGDASNLAWAFYARAARAADLPAHEVQFAVQSAVNAQPEQPGGYGLLIELRLSLGDPEGAREVWEELYQRFPAAADHPPALQWGPRIAAALGDPEWAAESAEDFLRRTQAFGAAGDLWDEMEAYVRGDLRAWYRYGSWDDAAA